METPLLSPCFPDNVRLKPRVVMSSGRVYAGGVWPAASILPHARPRPLLTHTLAARLQVTYTVVRTHQHRHPFSLNRLSSSADNRGDCEKFYFAMVAVFYAYVRYLGCRFAPCRMNGACTVCTQL